MDLTRDIGKGYSRSLYFKWLWISFRSHNSQLSWMRAELQSALGDRDDTSRGRRLLCLTDLPAYIKTIQKSSLSSEESEKVDAFYAEALHHYEHWLYSPPQE